MVVDKSTGWSSSIIVNIYKKKATNNNKNPSHWGGLDMHYSAKYFTKLFIHLMYKLLCIIIIIIIIIISNVTNDKVTSW